MKFATFVNTKGDRITLPLNEEDRLEDAKKRVPHGFKLQFQSVAPSPRFDPYNSFSIRDARKVQ